MGDYESVGLTAHHPTDYLRSAGRVFDISTVEGDGRFNNGIVSWFGFTRGFMGDDIGPKAIQIFATTELVTPARVPQRRTDHFSVSKDRAINPSVQDYADFSDAQTLVRIASETTNMPFNSSNGASVIAQQAGVFVKTGVHREELLAGFLTEPFKIIPEFPNVPSEFPQIIPEFPDLPGEVFYLARQRQKILG